MKVQGGGRYSKTYNARIVRINMEITGEWRVVNEANKRLEDPFRRRTLNA